MNWVDKLSARTWSILVIGMLAFAFSGCDGDTGPAGLDGQDGQDGVDGVDAPVPDGIDEAIANADPESCGTCHSTAGDQHQAGYNKYTDPSAFELTIQDATSVGPDAGGRYDLTMEFSIAYMGAPYLDDPVGTAPSVETLSFYVVEYDSPTDTFLQPGFSPFPSIGGDRVSNGDGTYTLTANVEYHFSGFESGAIIGQLGDGKFDFPDNPHTSANHLQMYEDLSHASFTIGNINTWSSTANVSACEKCHGAPYRKHGNTEAAVAGVPDFARCKTCHFDDRVGGHEDWQYMVDDPLNWANKVAPAPRAADYAYTANVMNDTHMSHALEFPYPQSMSNCVTCHEGKLDDILVDTNFDLAICKGCHVIEGTDAWPGEIYGQDLRPPPMTYLWAESTVPGLHNTAMTCTQCHGTTGFSSFSDMHSGYDDHIYDDTGVKYAAQYTVAIDALAFDPATNVLTIEFSANDVAIVPEVLVSLYGWDTKNFIVASHTSDGSTNCLDRRGNPGGCRMEFAPGDTNPLFTEDAGSVPGDWMVTLDLAAYVPTTFLPDDIPTLIADNVVKMIEVTITPELEVGGQEVVLAAVGDTFDIGGLAVVNDYFKGANATVDVVKCNACHEALASTFHDGSGRSGDGIEVCKNCHVTTRPGSHLELASRAIDSYVHAIHTFQPFDEDDVYNWNAYGADNDPDFDNGTTDPVFNARNAQHKSHTLPYFTALACEACHVAGTYNAPDQSKSMPGVLRASWALDDPTARAIGTIPEYVTGPASRACGACHRADMVVKDAAGELASFNAHTDAFGTLEENDDDDLILYGIIDKIMSMFE